MIEMCIYLLVFVVVVYLFSFLLENGVDDTRNTHFTHHTNTEYRTKWIKEKQNQIKRSILTCLCVFGLVIKMKEIASLTDLFDGCFFCFYFHFVVVYLCFWVLWEEVGNEGVGGVGETLAFILYVTVMFDLSR